MLQAAGCGLLVTVYCMLVAGYRLQVAGCRLLQIGY